MHTALQGLPHLDYIFSDACYMSSVEVAYEWRDCADYFIGSPTEIPGPGAPCQKVIPALFAIDNAAIKCYDPLRSRYYYDLDGVVKSLIGGEFYIMNGSRLIRPLHPYKYTPP